MSETRMHLDHQDWEHESKVDNLQATKQKKEVFIKDTWQKSVIIFSTVHSRKHPRC